MKTHNERDQTDAAFYQRFSSFLLILIDNGRYNSGGSEHDLALGVLLLSDNNTLGSFDGSERLALSGGTLKLEDDLLGLLSLLSEDGLGLSTESLLFHIISSLSLGDKGSLTGFVLGDFVERVLLQLWAVGSDGLWDVHHFV